MNGLAFCTAVERRYPRLKFLVISGWASADEAASIQSFISSPTILRMSSLTSARRWRNRPLNESHNSAQCLLGRECTYDDDRYLEGEGGGVGV